ncbi:MAG: tetratricopeptide repeat protein [Planctomycetota bacterium]|nr:MAG: tetratricopeptide repeat protein [Planctomycetota bacterium]
MEYINGRTVIGLLMAASIAVASGCGGQGRYTKEHTSLAKEKMNIMKSATEWDMAHQAFLAGDLEKALRKVDNSLSINPNVTKSHVLKGRILMEMGEVGAALRSLQTAVAIDPNYVDAHYYSGIAYERLAKPEEALTHYLAAISLDDYNDQYVVAAAEMLIDLDRTDEAVTLLKQSPAFDHSAGIHQTLGHIAQLDDDFTLAAEEFEAARLLAPDDLGILEDLTRAQFLAGNYPDAAYGLETLLAEEEYAQRRDLKRMHAECLLKLDRRTEARQAYLDLTSDPAAASDADAWIGLGNISYQVGDMNTLRKAATRAVAIAPDRKDGYVLWSLLHRAQGNAEASLRSIEDAIERDPTDPLLQTMRALALLDLGRQDEARKALSAALQIDPTNRAARAVLTRIEDDSAPVP